ncbi:hypothetical protein M2332_000657 [Sphingobium sp. B11D3A]|nr:hypothetical protein [Sphingobium sp. B11D3A]
MHYVVEYNRCVGDSIWRTQRALERCGYEVERVPQLTTLHIYRPKKIAFKQFASDLISRLQRTNGSFLLASSSGKCWTCNSGGNRPGKLVRVF